MNPRHVGQGCDALRNRMQVSVDADIALNRCHRALVDNGFDRAGLGTGNAAAECHHRPFEEKPTLLRA